MMLFVLIMTVVSNVQSGDNCPDCNGWSDCKREWTCGPTSWIGSATDAKNICATFTGMTCAVWRSCGSLCVGKDYKCCGAPQRSDVITGPQTNINFEDYVDDYTEHFHGYDYIFQIVYTVIALLGVLAVVSVWNSVMACYCYASKSANSQKYYKVPVKYDSEAQRVE
eukprot:UN09804